MNSPSQPWVSIPYSSVIGDEVAPNVYTSKLLVGNGTTHKVPVGIGVYNSGSWKTVQEAWIYTSGSWKQEW